LVAERLQTTDSDLSYADASEKTFNAARTQSAIKHEIACSEYSEPMDDVVVAEMDGAMKNAQSHIRPGDDDHGL